MLNLKVSIITPSYNQGNFIEETINSVLNQSYKNIEYIVVDGASSDITLEIINRYSKFISKVISERDSGQADAINKGIKSATGDLITWINSDDLLEPKAIERAVEVFTKFSDVDFLYGNIKLIDEYSRPLSVLKGQQVTKPSVFFNLDLPIPQQGSVWRKCVTDSIGLMDEKWHYVLDREFFLRICLDHRVMYINQLLGSFRQHNQSKSIKTLEPWIKEMPLMYDALSKEHNWPYRQDSKITKKVIASAHIHSAYLAFSAGKINSGIKNIFSACANYPAILFCDHIYSKLVNKLRIFFFKA